METPSEKAIRLLGGKSATARLFGITHWAASKWAIKVPAGRCIAIEEAVGGKVTRYQLRPDVFGKQEPQRNKKAA